MNEVCYLFLYHTKLTSALALETEPKEKTKPRAPIASKYSYSQGYSMAEDATA